jgi:hypothetical protein
VPNQCRTPGQAEIAFVGELIGGPRGRSLIGQRYIEGVSPRSIKRCAKYHESRQCTVRNADSITKAVQCGPKVGEPCKAVSVNAHKFLRRGVSKSSVSIASAQSRAHIVVTSLCANQTGHVATRHLFAWPVGGPRRRDRARYDQRGCCDPIDVARL